MYLVEISSNWFGKKSIFHLLVMIVMIFWDIAHNLHARNLSKRDMLVKQILALHFNQQEFILFLMIKNVSYCQGVFTSVIQT